MGKLSRSKMGSDWLHGICGCCDSGCAECCFNYGCCYQCNMGHGVELAHGSNCFLNCFCAQCCHPCVRCNTVTKYEIDESQAMSCLFCCCCLGCSKWIPSGLPAAVNAGQQQFQQPHQQQPPPG